MDRIEFLRRTDSRHLQTHIKYKIREVFLEREEELERKRESLKTMLAAEELQQEEEMANLFRARVLENMQKRLDWVAAANFQRSEAEREFLKLKQIQRELLNCEEMRPKESKKITEETKRVQLMQIAEKRQLEMKEKEIDKIWFDASMCLEKEKEKQQQYENHLKKIIANKAVGVLNSQLEHLKYLKELENEEKREEYVMNVRALNEDVIKADIEERQRLKKKIEEGERQRKELRALEADRLQKARQLQFNEAKQNEIQAIQLKQEEEMLKMKKDHDKESGIRYLQFSKDSKYEMYHRNKILDDALIANGSQIQFKPKGKIPYQKLIR